MSTYSSLKFELIGTGDQAGSWGATTNTNLGTAIEQAIAGMATLNTAKFTANVATLTLADTNAAQDARAVCLNITATLSAAGTVNVPAIQKPYLVINNSVGGYAVTVKVSGQTGVSVPNGKGMWVYNNGTDVVDGANYVTNALNATNATTATTATSATTATNVAGGTTGAVHYQSGVGATAFLGIGAANQVLTVNSGATAPQWVNQSTLSVGSATSAASATTANSATYATSAGSATTANSATSATTATNIAGGAANRIPYNTGSGATSFITAPSVASTYLQWNGSALTWAAATSTPPGGSDTQIQFNNSGAFGGSADFVINGTSGIVSFGQDPSINAVYVGQGNVRGASNTRVGAAAFNAAITSGTNMTAIGANALYSATTNSYSTAVGSNALYSAATGASNTAIGAYALYSVNGGSANTALGVDAGSSTTTGTNNTFVGRNSGYFSTTGSYNTCLGAGAGQRVLGTNNTFVGYNAGAGQSGTQTNSDNTFIGYGSGAYVTTGTQNVILGGYDGYAGGALDITTSSGYVVLSDGGGNVRMYFNGSGALYSYGVYNNTVGGTNRDVYVDNSGKIGYVSSTRESKMNISDLTDVSWLYRLSPVSFNYRKKDDAGNYTTEADGDIEYGLIADDAETVRQDLCFYDDVGGVKTLRGVKYSKLTAPLLKAVQDQKTLIDQLLARIESLEAKTAAL